MSVYYGFIKTAKLLALEYSNVSTYIWDGIREKIPSCD